MITYHKKQQLEPKQAAGPEYEITLALTAQPPLHVTASSTLVTVSVQGPVPQTASHGLKSTPRRHSWNRRNASVHMLRVSQKMLSFQENEHEELLQYERLRNQYILLNKSHFLMLR